MGCCTHTAAFPQVHSERGRESIKQPRVFSALQAFWPGLEVLGGEVGMAQQLLDTMMGLWDVHQSLPDVSVLERSLSWPAAFPAFTPAPGPGLEVCKAHSLCQGQPIAA